MTGGTDAKGTGLVGGERAVLLVLAAVAVVALLHRASGGLVLASTPATCALFAGALAVLGAVAWRTPRLGERTRPDPVVIGLAGLAALLAAATYQGGEVGIGGDYRMHRMYAYQLLNGYAFSHEPYRGVAGHYPPLVHALLAVVARTTGLTVHYAMALVSIVVSAGVALEAARIARLAGLSRAGARTLAALLVGWGGAWWVELREFQLFLPAVQLSLPFLSRNLALLLVLIGLGLVLRFDAARCGVPGARVGRGDALAGVLVVGLLGLTRPWEFGFGVLAWAALAIVYRSRGFAGCLALAIGIASPYWLPLVADWLALGIHAEREVTRREDFPVSPTTWLPLAPFVLAASFSMRAMPRAVRAAAAALGLALLVPLLVAATARLGVGTALGLEGGLVKLERVGQLAALALYVVAAFGVARLAARSGAGRLVGGVVAAVVAIGGVTTLRANAILLDGGPTLPSARWTRPPRYVFDLAGSPFYLRHLLEDPKAVVLAPSALGHLTASRNGVDVGWSHRAAPIWATATAGALSSQEREREVDRFYAGLARGVVDGEVLRRFGARYFVASSPAAAALPEIESLGSIGSFAGRDWYVLEWSAAPSSPSSAPSALASPSAAP